MAMSPLLHRHHPSSNSDVLFFQSSNDLASMASLGLPTPTPYPNEAVQPQAVAEGESIVGESNDEIASLRQSFDAYAQWIAQYLQEQASASASSATLVDLHEKETDSTSPSDLILDIHMATIARNKLHYIKLASDASRELAKRMREAEAMRPMAPLSPTSPPAFWPSSLVENYCQTLRSCTEALSSALEAQQAASYYQLSPSASSSDNAHAATFTHLSQISSSLEQRLHHDRYALYLMMTNDVQEALEACSWPPPLTSNSSSSSTSSTLLSSAGEPAQPIHPSHPLVTSFSLQAEEDQYKVQRLNALMACLNGLQMVCEAEQFRALFSFNNNSGTTPIDPQSAVAAGDESSAAKGLPDEPMLWSMLQLTSKLQASLMTHFAPETEAGRLDRPQWLPDTVIAFMKQHGPLLDVLQPSLVASGLHERYHASVEFGRAVRETVKNVLRASRLPPLLSGGEAYDGLWISQVDAIVSFENNLAPFLGAAHLITSAPPSSNQPSIHLSPSSSVGLGGGGRERHGILSSLHGDLPEPLIKGSCLGAITQEQDFLNAWAGAERRAMELRLSASISSSSSASLPTPLGAMASEDSQGVEKEAWRMEFCPPSHIEAFAGEIKSIVARSRHAPSTTDQRSFLDLSLGPLLDGLEWCLRQELDGSSSSNPPSLFNGAGGRGGGISPTASSEVSFASNTGSGAHVGPHPHLHTSRLDLKSLLSLPSPSSSFSHSSSTNNQNQGGGKAPGIFSSEARARAVCICLNTARYLQHQLEECINGPAMYRIRREEREASTNLAPPPPMATSASHHHSVRNNNNSINLFSPSKAAGFDDLSSSLSTLNPAPLPSLSTSTPFHTYANGDDGHHNANPSTVLGYRAISLKALHREWCLKLAREVSRVFGRLAVKYREEAALISPVYPQHPDFLHPPSLPPHPPTTPHPSSSSSSAAVLASPQTIEAAAVSLEMEAVLNSPGSAPCEAIRPSLATLDAYLSTLSRHLDAPSFRDLWRSVAVPVNRFMFNQIATEARFTLASSAQLTVDATYLSHLFTRYSPQVGGGGGGGGRRGLGGLGGLKETLAACRLLLMSSSEAGEVMRRASGLAVSMGGNAAGAPAGYKKDEMLSRMGVACLTPQQIMSVIERRVY